MSLEATGVLDFSWSSPSIVYDSLAIDVHKNDNFITRDFQTGNSFSVSGLIEGDSAFLRVIPTYFDAFYTGSQIITSTQSVPVTNFHVSGKTIEISGLSVNGENVDILKTVTGINATGSYFSQNTELEFDIINPRDGSNIIFSDQEPFYSGLKFFPMSGSTELTTGQADANSFIFENSYYSRDILLKCVAEDIYGSGVTGNIFLQNEPISVLSAQNSFGDYISNGSGSFNILPEYSATATGVEYVIYDSDLYTSFLVSGLSSTTTSITGLYPTDTSGFLELTPFDWFGSGNKFRAESPLFLSSSSFLNFSNVINDRTLETSSGINILFDVEENNTSGHYSQISIDSAPDYSFNSDSYFTGQFEDFTLYTFDAFSSRTGTHENFYYSINLYQSGTNLLQDNATGSFYVARPRIVNSTVDFNYENGITTIHFESEPHLNFTGVNLLFSGAGSSSFSVMDTPSFESGSINVSGEVRLERAYDSYILDSQGVSGSGSRPSISFTEIPFPSIESSINVVLRNNEGSFIDKVSAFRKPSLKIVSGIVPDYISGVTQFNDHENHFLEDTVIGHYIDLPPLGTSRNKRYVVTGMSYTGYSSIGPATGIYESGREFVYKFTPVDGYGSGIVSSAFASSFSTNAIAESVDQNLQTAEGNITTAQTNIGELQTGVVYTSGFQFVKGEKTFDEANVTGQLVVGDELSGIALEVSNDGLEVAVDTNITGSLTIGNPTSGIILEASEDRISINSDLYVTGDVHATGTFLYNNMPPQTSNSYGKSGQMAFDHAYLYVCTGLNSWARVEFTDTSW